MKLLIVEDSAQMRRMMKSLVSDLATELYECAAGAGALSAYREHRPDWVLMDIKMKEIDGLAATRQIKVAFPETRVLSSPAATMPSCVRRRAVRARAPM